MDSEVATFFNQWEKDQQQLKEDAPNITRGFGGMFQAVMKEGALPVREKD